MIIRVAVVFAVMAVMSPAVSGAGFVQVRNFGRDTYRAGAQCWDVAVDSLGKVYTANSEGMLVYDGARWSKYNLPNYTSVRALMFDGPTGRMYASGSAEFGYFSPDSLTGVLHYTSLMGLFDPPERDFSEVWRIERGNDGCIWFQSDHHLFRYDGERVATYAAGGRISRVAILGGEVCVALEDGRLCRLAGNEFRKLPGTDILAGKKIVGLLPVPSRRQLLVVTSVDGLFVYDGSETTPLDSDIDGFLRASQVFCAASLGDEYVFGTVTRGAVIKNLGTGVTRYINRDSGMQNNTVLGVRFDSSGNLWMCLDNGLDYAVCNSPVTDLVGRDSDIGTGYASFTAAGMIYFGTNQGLYSAALPLVSSPSSPDLRRELHGQIWSVTPGAGPRDEDFFVAGDAGAWSHDASGFHRIDGLPGTYKILPLVDAPALALASTYAHFYLVERVDGRWRAAGTVGGYSDDNGSFVIDRYGYIWMSHWIKGVYRLHFNTATRTFDERRLFNAASGLPEDRNNTVSLVDGRPIVTTHYGFYTYDYFSESIVRYPALDTVFDSEEPQTLFPLPDGCLVLTDRSGLMVAQPDAERKLRVGFVAPRLLSDKLIRGFENVAMDDCGDLIVSNQDGFWSIDVGERSSAGDVAPRPFISAVWANGDSLVYVARLRISDTEALSVPYNLNSLRLEFGYPDYRSDNGVVFSSRLDEYDADWSPYGSESSREYTRLHEGRYTMRMRAMNMHTGAVDEIVFRFTVTPPWYRTTVAWTVYLLLGVAAMAGVYILARRWKRRAERRVEISKEAEMEALRRQTEQEALRKDYCIATLKSEQLEIDIKHKSNELSSTTMNLIHKNEALRDIADRIDRLMAMDGSGVDADLIRRRLASIRRSIDDSISRNDWNVFDENFDVVYGDFTRRLLQLHPSLTIADKRLCCYIKMGLSSKEIAPLLNITFKSVEMARYRVRKKMNLSTDTSLTDYLQNLE